MIAFLFLLSDHNYFGRFSAFNSTPVFNADENEYTLTQRQHKVLKRAYYAAISYVDDLVGQILKELK